MEAWWSGLGIYNQVLFVIAASMTVFMLLQLVALLLGSILPDSSFDTDFDLDVGDSVNDGGAFEIFGLQLLNLRSITTFLAIGGWSIFTFNQMMHVALSTILGLLIGAGAGVLISYVMKKLLSLQNVGNFEINTAVDKTGEVYLTVPAAKSGTGKVNISMTERMVELEAMTDSDKPLTTGTPIKVVGVVGQNVVLVSCLSADGETTLVTQE